jgi:hypothetical protein
MKLVYLIPLAIFVISMIILYIANKKSEKWAEKYDEEMKHIPYWRW